MDWKISIGTSLIICFLFLNLTTAATENEKLHNNLSKRVWTKLGHSLELSCISLPNRTLDNCEWNRNDGLTISSNFDSESEDPAVPGYTISLPELFTGECKMRIERVTPSDTTLWNCSFIDKEIQRPYSARVELVLTKKPTSPEILDKDYFEHLLDGEDGLAGNSTVNVTCCTKNGVPSAILTLLLDNKTMLTSGNEIGSNDCLIWPSINFNWTDNGRELRCRAQHDEYTDEDKIEDFVNVNVMYAPKFLNIADALNGSTIAYLANSTDGGELINVTFSGNPQPIVEWKTNSNFSSMVNYSTRVEEISEWRWVTILTLNTTKMLDGRVIPFNLVLSNSFGVKSVTFQIQKPAGRSEESNQPSWLWLFCIIIGAVIVQATLVLFVMLSRHYGWCCYSNRSGKLSVKRRQAVKSQEMKVMKPRTRQAKPLNPSDISTPLMIPANYRPGEDQVYLPPKRYNWRYPGEAEDESDGDFRVDSEEAQVHRIYPDNDDNDPEESTGGVEGGRTPRQST